MSLQYVYKYLDDRGTVVYVGITNDMKKRVYQHRSDKLGEIKNPVIYYFPVKYRADADMLETYLINYYDTKKYYNVSKTSKGDVSFLGEICDCLPWRMFMGRVDEDVEPFVASTLKKEVIVTETTLVDMRSIDGIIKKHDEDIENVKCYIDREISDERQVIDFIKSFDEERKNIPFVARGLYLHKKRLLCLRLLKKSIAHHPFIFDDSRKKKYNRLLWIGEHIKYDLEKHEGQKYDDRIA